MATSTMSVPGIGRATAFALSQRGFRSAEDLAAANEEELAAVPGFGANRAARVIESAQSLIGAPPPESDAASAQETETGGTAESLAGKKSDKKAAKKPKAGKKAKAKKKKGEKKADKPKRKKKSTGSKKTGKKSKKASKGKKAGKK